MPPMQLSQALGKHESGRIPGSFQGPRLSGLAGWIGSQKLQTTNFEFLYSFLFSQGVKAVLF